MKTNILIVIFLCFVFTACSFNQRKYDQAFRHLKKSCYDHIEQNEFPQAAIIARSLLEAEPDNDEVKKIKEQVLQKQPELKILYLKSILGSNYSDRISRDNDITSQLLLYFPNRFLDILDLFTLEMGPCIGLGANVDITEYVSLGQQVSLMEVMGGLDRRYPSYRFTTKIGTELAFYELGALVEERVTTKDSTFTSYEKNGIKSPIDKPYQYSRDFWVVGAQANAGIFAVGFGIHLLEILDFIAGFFMIDILKDDLGSSQKIELSNSDEENLRQLAKQVSLRVQKK